ncbi:MAG: molybdopterin-dependent oxidoreductase [Chloracidobacterium sp.]|nr:molybdopterin-dependent oxidoreductase [Chloracidobacterium sp.]
MKEKEEKVLLEKVRELQSDGDDTRENTARILNEKRVIGPPLDEKQAKAEMSKRSRRTFLIGGAAAITAFFGWRWMPDDAKMSLLRRTLEFNETVGRFFYKPSRLAPEFPSERISPRRVNGMIGMEQEHDQAAWSLNVGGVYGADEDLILSLDDLRALPRTAMITELMCIEGWSIIVQWAGVRFSDFAAKYSPKTIDGSRPDVAGRPDKLLPYVSLSTPDNGYFVGWDTASILHPQTLLAYEMNGEPLLPEHGAPLRLASPTKYGIKQIKRIGRIEFTTERPRDYWAESGYDWYSGL